MESAKRSVVVAGASGFIGRLLVSDLLTSGCRVVALVRSTGGALPGNDPGLTTVAWDGKNDGEWRRFLSGADAVVNLSGESIGAARWTVARKAKLLQSRIGPTRVLVNAMKNASSNLSAFINASAVGYYGDVPEGEVTEERGAGNDFLSGICSEWEAEAHEATRFGVRVVTLRSGVVLDARQGALPRMLLPFRLFLGGPLGSGRQWFPWIHRDDEIRAIRFALDSQLISGPLNLTAPNAVRMDEFAAILGRVLHRPNAVRVPAFVLRIVLREMANMVLTGQRAVPAKLLGAGFTFRFGTLETALADLLGKA